MTSALRRGATLVEAMARRRSPDRLLSDALSVLGQLVDGTPTQPLGEFETHSQRLAAMSRAVEALRKVEEGRWALWNPQRLRELSDQELEEYLQRAADRAAHRPGAN